MGSQKPLITVHMGSQKPLITVHMGSQKPLITVHMGSQKPLITVHMGSQKPLITVHMGSQKPLITERQTIQWSKEIKDNDLQSIKSINTDSSKDSCWTHVLRYCKQFLHHMWHPLCYSSLQIWL